MNLDLNDNIKALIAYSHTDRFQQLWNDHHSFEYLTSRGQLFLEIFNTYNLKLTDRNEKTTNDLIKLLTKREFFINLVNKGISNAMNEISNVLKLTEEVKDSISIPKFDITDKEYNLFYESSKTGFKESSLYHMARQQFNDDYAEKQFDKHWEIVGEIFNNVIAENYMKDLNKRDIKDIPESFKQTPSGAFMLKNKKYTIKKFF